LKLAEGANHLSVLLWPRDGERLAVTVYDASGHELAAQAEPAPGGALLLDLDGLAGDRAYYVAVRGGPGRYELAVAVEAPAFPLAVSATGALTAGQPQAFRGFVLPQGGVIQLEVATQPPAGLVGAVEVTLFDQQGNLVLDQVVQAGQLFSVDLLLGPGAYTLRLVAATAEGSALPNVPFTVSSLLLNDPIGPQLIDPTSPPPVNPAPVWYDTGFVSLLALVDPYGRPISPLQSPLPVVRLP
jgi:hypothetical protein